MTTLIDGASALGLDLDEVQAAKLIAHLDLLDEWGERMNLTAIRERSQQVTKHVLDSLTVYPWLRGPRVADIGSGAGFPGIPLAIVAPQIQFTLIESTGKKCRFLEHVRDALELGNVEVVQSRAEDYKPAERFDTVLARAVGPLADLVRYGGKLVEFSEGRFLAMKGRDAGRRTGEAAEWLEIGRSAQIDGAWSRRGTTPGRTRALAQAARGDQAD